MPDVYKELFCSPHTAFKHSTFPKVMFYGTAQSLLKLNFHLCQKFPVHQCFAFLPMKFKYLIAS